MRKLLQTTDDPVALVLRLALAIVIFPHGAQKVLGWFGGPGLSGAYGYLHGMMHLPAPIAWLEIAIEFLCPILLLVGFLGRLAALGIGIVMVGAIVTVHSKVGFFMNWSGQQHGEGFEYHILALACVLGILIRGSGALSVDRSVSRQWDEPLYGSRRV